MRFSFCAGLATYLASHVALARSSTGDRILVVQDPFASGSYDLFWNSLRERGYDVTHRSSEAAVPLLTEHDELAFDHLILFAPTAKALPADLSPQRLYSFIQSSGNILVALSPDLSEFWRDFAREFDIEFDDRQSNVIDHFNYDSNFSDDFHTTLIVSVDQTPSPVISKLTQSGAPILYRGIGHARGELPLLVPILHAPATAYSSDPTSTTTVDDQYISGSRIGLVSALQSKNNARIAFSGSLDMFSDTFVTSKIRTQTGLEIAGNAAFIRDLSAWTFQERGVLRVDKMHHTRASDGVSLPLYRVRQELTFNVDVTSYVDDAWTGFDSDDLQLEFTMLDPHLRLPLQASQNTRNSTSFSAHFKTPDAHGVFTMRFDYRRTGWSFLDEKLVVSITPPRHDEYARFIGGAVPFYAGAFSVSIGFIAFIFLWLLQ